MHWLKWCISVPEDCLFIFLANSADPDTMLPYAAFHLGLYCLSKYLFIGIQNEKGEILFSGHNVSIAHLNHTQPSPCLKRAAAATDKEYMKWLSSRYTRFSSITLAYWEILRAFLSFADFLQKNLQKKSFRNTTRVPNSLDPDQAQTTIECRVNPLPASGDFTNSLDLDQSGENVSSDLDPNCYPL